MLAPPKEIVYPVIRGEPRNISGAPMKRLFLSTSDKKLGGVCGGIAEYMELDPTIVRLLTVVLALFTAVIPVLIAYILAWIIVPRNPGS